MSNESKFARYSMCAGSFFTLATPLVHYTPSFEWRNDDIHFFIVMAASVAYLAGSLLTWQDAKKLDEVRAAGGNAFYNGNNWKRRWGDSSRSIGLGLYFAAFIAMGSGPHETRAQDAIVNGLAIFALYLFEMFGRFYLHNGNIEPGGEEGHHEHNETTRLVPH